VRNISKELKLLAKSPLEGISVSPNERDLSDIEATITGPQDTPFEDGVFRVRLRLGADFPQAPPKGFFLTKIFHPNVAESSGEICVNTLKKDWKESFGIKQILLTIKCLLIVPNPESALNEEAGRLLLEHYDDYFSRAKTYTAVHAKPTVSSTSEASTSTTSSTSSTSSSTTEDSQAEKTKEDGLENEGSKENLSNNTASSGAAAGKPSSVQAAPAKKPAAAANKPKRGVKRL